MNYKSTIDKLQLALNKGGQFIVMVNTNQFYSEEQKRPINMYSVKLREVQDGRNKYTEIFKSAIQLHIVLFLRNLYNYTQGIEIVPETSNVPKHLQFNQKWKEFAEDFL